MVVWQLLYTFYVLVKQFISSAAWTFGNCPLFSCRYSPLKVDNRHNGAAGLTNFFCVFCVLVEVLIIERLGVASCCFILIIIISFIWFLVPLALVAFTCVVGVYIFD